MTKLVGYARVSTRQQSTDRQETDLLAAGVRRDDLYIDHGVSGARASGAQFDRAHDALIAGDTLVITTLDRLGRSTQNMLAFAEELRGRGAGLRVLNLGGGDVDTSTPMGSMLFTIMAALAQMEHEIRSERVTDSISKRSTAGKDLGARPQRITDSQIRSALGLIEGGTSAAQVARDLGMSRATFYRRSRTLHQEPTSSTAPDTNRSQKSQRAVNSSRESRGRRHLFQTGGCFNRRRDPDRRRAPNLPGRPVGRDSGADSHKGEGPRAAAGRRRETAHLLRATGDADAAEGVAQCRESCIVGEESRSRIRFLHSEHGYIHREVRGGYELTLSRGTVIYAMLIAH